MATTEHTHEDHDHVHGPGCGHTAIVHEGHIDFIHDGHLHQPHGDHVDEHSLPVNDELPDACNKAHDCGEHVHGSDCGHESVPHAEHTDYIVDGRLHHPHDGHCDDHGGLKLA